MRKALVLFVLLFVSLFSVFSLISPENPFFENPARLFFYNQARTLGADVKFGFSPVLENEPYFSTPYLGAKAEFTSKYAQAGVSLDISFADRNKDQDTIYYNIYNNVKFNVGAAYGYKAIGGGFLLEAGAKLQRLNCPISSTSPVLDFFNQALFAEYDRVQNSEYTNLKAGLGIEVAPVSFYVLVPSVMTYTDGNTNFDIKNTYEDLEVSLGYTSDRFGTRGRLRTLVFDAEATVSSVFEESERALDLAAAFTLQLSRDRNICFSGSYKGPLFDDSEAKTYYYGSLSYTAEKLVFTLEATVPADKAERSYFTFRTSLLF